MVDSPDALPETPHVVADVEVDAIKLDALVRGALTYQLIEMTWGFALRGSDQQEYAYSFAGTASSNDSSINSARSALRRPWAARSSWHARPSP